MSTLFDTFKARAEAVSAEVHRVPTRSGAIEFIANFLRAEQGRAVWVAGSLLEGVDRAGLTQAIPGLTFDVTQHAAEASKVGVSQVECAIATTGTLVTDAAPVERRLASALPVIHVAVVATDTIQPDMATALKRIHPTTSGASVGLRSACATMGFIPAPASRSRMSSALDAICAPNSSSRKFRPLTVYFRGLARASWMAS